jgi:hypothetical protein
MPFLFICPHCESQTLVDDRLEGESGLCATCGKLVTVERLRSQSSGRGLAGRLSTSSAPTPQSIQLMIVLLIASLLLAGIFGWVAVTLIVPRLTRFASSQSLQTAANLARIGAALQAYHQTHGRFPPAYLTDDQGVPIHSWRVLILPYLDESVLYAAYRFDEPWDGPSNSRLVSRMPTVFASPSDVADPSIGVTSFLAITGTGTLFPPDASASRSDVLDRLEDTILVVESAESEISWLEPEDLLVSRMSFQLNQAPRLSIRTRDSSSPHVLRADGTVRRLRASTPARTVQGMTTINGLEVIDWSVAEAP